MARDEARHDMEIDALAETIAETDGEVARARSIASASPAG